MIGPRSMWRRIVVVVAPSCLARVAYPSRDYAELGLVSGLLGSMLIVLGLSPMIRFCRHVAADGT